MDKSHRGNSQIGIFTQWPVRSPLGLELSGPIPHRWIDHDTAQHPPQAFEGGEWPLCPYGSEPALRRIIAHRLESHGVTCARGVPDARPDAWMTHEVSGHNVGIPPLAIHRSHCRSPNQGRRRAASSNTRHGSSGNSSSVASKASRAANRPCGVGGALAHGPGRARLPVMRPGRGDETPHGCRPL
jgi:hypothetical protein